MKFNNNVWAFLYEMYKRSSAKSPRFFQVIQAIGMVAALITGIPLAIQQFEMVTGVEIKLPDIVNHYIMRVIFWCGVVVKLMGKLPTSIMPEDRPAAFPFTNKTK